MLLATPANQNSFLLSACLLLGAGDISARAKQPVSMVSWGKDRSRRQLNSSRALNTPRNMKNRDSKLTIIILVVHHLFFYNMSPDLTTLHLWDISLLIVTSPRWSEVTEQSHFSSSVWETAIKGLETHLRHVVTDVKLTFDDSIFDN